MVLILLPTPTLCLPLGLDHKHLLLSDVNPLIIANTPVQTSLKLATAFLCFW